MGSEQSRLYTIQITRPNRCFKVNTYGNHDDALRMYAGLSTYIAAIDLDVRFDLHVRNDDGSDYIRWNGNKIDLINSILDFCQAHAILLDQTIFRDAAFAFVSSGIPMPINLAFTIAVGNGMILPAQVPLAIGYYSTLVSGTMISPDECPLCFHPDFRVTYISGCSHGFHSVCIRRWKWISPRYPLATCPLCRCLFW